MSEASLAQRIGFRLGVDSIFSKNRYVVQAPETFTFEKIGGVWKYVKPDGQVDAGAVQIKTIERLQALTDQIRELSKKDRT